MEKENELPSIPGIVNRTQSNSIFLPLMKINMSSHTDTYFKEQNRQEEALHFVLVNLYSKVGNLC